MTTKLSVFSSSLTLYTSMLGAGINFMPNAFESVGYLNALFIMSFIGLLSFCTLYAVAFTASQRGSIKGTSYSELGYNISYPLGIIVDLSILLALCLISLAYFTYIVQMAVLFFTGIKNGDEKFFYYKLIFMTVIMFIFYHLSLQKDLSRLRFTYYACVISVFYLIVLLLALNCFLKDKISNGDFKAFNSNYSTGLPLFILVFSCQVNMVQIFNVMEKKNTKSILLVSFFSSLAGVITYFIIGFLGYKLFGAKANGLDMVNIFCDKNSILNSYLSQYSFLKYLPSFAVIGAMVVITGSFPLQINPAVSIFVKLSGTQNEDKRRITVITVFCIIIYLINLHSKLSLSLVLGIVGAIFNNFICFLFPGIYYLTTCRRIGLLSLIFIMIMGLSILAGVYILYTIFTNK